MGDTIRSENLGDRCESFFVATARKGTGVIR